MRYMAGILGFTCIYAYMYMFDFHIYCDKSHIEPRIWKEPTFLVLTMHINSIRCIFGSEQRTKYEYTNIISNHTMYIYTKCANRLTSLDFTDIHRYTLHACICNYFLEVCSQMRKNVPNRTSIDVLLVIIGAQPSVCPSWRTSWFRYEMGDPLFSHIRVLSYTTSFTVKCIYVCVYVYIPRWVR